MLGVTTNLKSGIDVKTRVFQFLQKTACVLCAVMAALGPAVYAQDARDYKIDAQDAATGLRALAVQGDFQVFFPTELTSGKTIHAVQGHYTVTMAMDVALRGTGLIYKASGSGTYVVQQGGTDPVPFVGSSDASAAIAQNAATPGTKETNLGAETASPASVDQQATDMGSRKSSGGTQELGPVLVTGSRLLRTAKEGAQEVNVYTSQQIQQSGQTTITDFLNTLPEVSVSTTEAVHGGGGGQGTVRLRGLPLGTTLVLLNGRRVEDNNVGTSEPFFDLNSVPSALVDRIEIVPQGSSAVYGSDALAGVVNIILKKNLNGGQADVHYGFANGTDESSVDLAWGHRWSRGSFSIMGTYKTNSELSGSERTLTASQDYTSYGGGNGQANYCNPGNVYSTDGSNLPGFNSSLAGVKSGVTGKPSLSDFTPGQENQCGYWSEFGLIPVNHVTSIMANGDYDLTNSVQIFTELLYSHQQQTVSETNPGALYQQPVPASNAFNPFGETVLVNYLFPAATKDATDTAFVRPLVGLRGTVFDRWNWEVAGWETQAHTVSDQPNFVDDLSLTGVAPPALITALASSNPTTAFNPFTTGQPASQSLLDSIMFTNRSSYVGRSEVVNGFVSGPVWTLPSGTISAVVGAEYDRDALESADPEYGTTSSDHRDLHSFFGELRLPLWANHTHPEAGDVLALTAALRYDDYDDFGSKDSPQYGIEWRPNESVLMRAAYAKAFAAPTLSDLFEPSGVVPNYPVSDTQNGGTTELVNYIYGGNSNLKPQTGQSRSVGIVWSPKTIHGLQASIEYWGIDQINRTSTLTPQIIIDNPELFPGRITRNPDGTIQSVDATTVNFGGLDVSGFDFDLTYKFATDIGTFTPSLAATEIYKYLAALTPGAPETNRVGQANLDAFSPRWKGTVAVGWNRGPYSANVDGRYVGSYQDYGPLTNGQVQTLGKFWLYDVNAKYQIGQAWKLHNKFMSGLFAQIGAVNLFNSLPKFSTYNDSTVGYDAQEYDIRGRFLYANLGVRW